MKGWLLSCVFGATAAMSLSAIGQVVGTRPGAPPHEIVEATLGPAALNVRAALQADVARSITVAEKSSEVSANALVEAAFRVAEASPLASSDVTGALPQIRLAMAEVDDEGGAPLPRQNAGLEENHSPLFVDSPNPAAGELPYLRYYVYSETPPPEKPAEIVLQALKNIPVGTPAEEIKRAATAFGLDYNFMMAVAKIESGFNPRERTGSYIGLFQLSRAEFKQYGTGDITNPRDNAVAAAYKFINEATLFEFITHKRPTFSDLYLIHQQGWDGAAQHISHPDRIAWKSMCATQEGLEKGERWCKHAIWWNTLPAVKRTWKSVDRLTSGAFVAMWRDRIDSLYARYAGVDAQEAQQQDPKQQEAKPQQTASVRAAESRARPGSDMAQQQALLHY